MKDRRFNSGLFLILFVLATTLINLGSAQCWDHSRPSGENWANDWDDNVDYDCGKGYSISRIRSIHRDCIEDRIWAFSCESNSAAQHCSWSHVLNSYDGLLDYKCPHDGFISGIYSWHKNGREDRRITSCEEVRNQLLISYGKGVLNDHELLLLCELKRSNILDLPHSFPEFNFDDLETTSACPNFASTNATCPFSLKCSME